MKSIYSVAICAAMMISTAIVGQAAPKVKHISPAAQARASFENIEAWSGSIAEAAYQLEAKSKTQTDAQAHFGDLDILKEKVNNIAREVLALDAERAGLEDWEVRVLDEIIPLMQEIAGTTDRAIQTSSSTRAAFWTTSYQHDAERIAHDAEQVNRIVDGNLKLAAARDREQRLESKLGETSDTR